MSVISRHPVVPFFLLAYALSWAAIPWQSFFAPGVLVAALIVVSLTEGVAGLTSHGFAADPLAGELDLVRPRNRRCP